MSRLFLLALVSAVGLAQTPAHPKVPRTWDETRLQDWATPLAELGVRPTHIFAREYYSLPVDNLKTYPVYFPGREPAGYWEMLQRVGPKPLIDPAKLKTEADWIEAGRRVFQDADHVHLRTLDPELIALARDAKALRERAPDILPDGTLPDLRWVPTKDGVALTAPNCSSCHTAYLDDGRTIPGAPFMGLKRWRTTAIIGKIHVANRIVNAHSPFIMPPGGFGERLYQAWGVPWLRDDIHERLKSFTEADYEPLRAAFSQSGGLPRWNGSIFYPAKMPDLIGIKDRKYIDHTATHLHRDIGDLMRYAALVTAAETVEFGGHRVLAAAAKRVRARRSDEELYALSLYLYSLQPPPNPNRFDDKARAGEHVFMRSGCGVCHTPPLYTNNKLTLATGFSPPGDTPATLDVIRVYVGTDPGLALQTRKGTGYYKVPSLKGLWYRGRYLHHGAVASLEEMFNPDRLNDNHVPGGWRPYGTKTFAIRGHEFGLALSVEEREQLIAFLRTL